MSTRSTHETGPMPSPDLDAQYETGSVTSHDGTTIGFRRFGHGPGVVVLHGTMSSAHNHTELARALAGSFTVYVPDRRGRGLSGPVGEAYSIDREVDDLRPLVQATGARNVLGVSSGGIVALNAALAMPAIDKVAVLRATVLRGRFFAETGGPSAAA